MLIDAQLSIPTVSVLDSLTALAMQARSVVKALILLKLRNISNSTTVENKNHTDSFSRSRKL